MGYKKAISFSRIEPLRSSSSPASLSERPRLSLPYLSPDLATSKENLKYFIFINIISSNNKIINAQHACEGMEGISWPRCSISRFFSICYGCVHLCSFLLFRERNRLRLSCMCSSRSQRLRIDAFSCSFAACLGPLFYSRFIASSSFEGCFLHQTACFEWKKLLRQRLVWNYRKPKDLCFRGRQSRSPLGLW